MSRKTPPCGRAAAFLDLRVDGARHVVPRRQLRRPAMVGLAALREGVHPGPRLLVRGGVLVAAVLRQVAPHEALAIRVAQDAALAAHGLGDEQAAHAGRLDHARGVELHELHVDELRAGAPGQRVAVAGGLPGVGGDGEGASRPAGGQDDGTRREGHGHAVRAPVADGAEDAGRPDGQARDDGLLVDLHADGHAAVLQRPDELQARCGRRRGRGADRCGRRRAAAGCARLACGRRRRPRPPARARGPAPPGRAARPCAGC